MVISTGVDIHQIGVAPCKCSDLASVPIDEQLIKLGGIVPATSKRPRTGFTLSRLAYQQIMRLECRVSPQAMDRTIRRNTAPMHPATVPVLAILLHDR